MAIKTAPILIYCAGGNRRMAEIALATGFRYGARLPDTVYYPLWFADQDYHHPDRTTYMTALAKYKPVMATVLDWQQEEQLTEVLDWAEEASQYIEQVLIIPKVLGGIARIPRRINGKDVVLGYSVPTRYGGTSIPVHEWAGWPIHLLGGSPHRQIETWLYLTSLAEVVSVDGNYAQKMAVKYCQFWTPGKAHYARDRYWPRIKEADGHYWGEDTPYEAFRRSCVNIKMAWQSLTSA